MHVPLLMVLHLMVNFRIFFRTVTILELHNFIVLVVVVQGMIT